MTKALNWIQQEQEDFGRALMRAPQRMASATIADAYNKTFDDFVADELADIQAERAKRQARLEHTARLARAREQCILEAERDWHHSPEHVEARQEEAAAQILTDTAAAGAGKSRQRQQEEHILQILRGLDYDPQRLPRAPAGAPGPKKEARTRAKMTPRVFEKAWERLRKFGDIADAQ